MTDILEHRETVESVRSAIELLDEMEKMIVKLQYFEDVKPEDIRAMMNVPQRIYEETLSKALTKLRERLHE